MARGIYGRKAKERKGMLKNPHKRGSGNRTENEIKLATEEAIKKALEK